MSRPTNTPGGGQPNTPPMYGPDSKPPAAEYGLRRSYCAKLGMSQAQFTQLFGSQGNPKARGQAASDAAAWARNLPKAQG